MRLLLKIKFMNYWQVYKKLVWAWLDAVYKGTNKDVVKSLLNGKGVSYTFDIPYPIACKMFEQWKRERWIETNPK